MVPNRAKRLINVHLAWWKKDLYLQFASIIQIKYNEKNCYQIENSSTERTDFFLLFRRQFVNFYISTQSLKGIKKK